MKARNLFLGFAGGLTGLLISLATWQAFGQNEIAFAENVPLTYTQITWNSRSLDADSSDGERKLQVGAIRSDRSTALTTYGNSSDGTPSDLRVVVDMEHSRVFMLDSSLRSVTTSYLTADSIAGKQNRNPTCHDGEISGSIIGYEVTRILHSPSAPAGTTASRLRSETLVAPALGCLPLEHKLIMTYEDGSERDIRVTRVIDVQVGQPDDAYFNIPQDYAEMSPTSRMQATGLGLDTISNDLLLHDAERKYQLAQEQ